jgi:photosystem II stability/assembly factor-like uncharacterized protein
MRGVILVGTAVTRPDAIGSLYRFEAGRGWERPQTLSDDAAVQAITPHPTKPDTVFVAARKGLFESNDAGATWRELNAPADVQYWSFLVDPENPERMFAGTAPPGVMRSSDGGKTWTRSACESNERYDIKFGASRMMKLAFHPTDKRIMYGCSEIQGMYVSTDGGENWRRANEGVDALSKLPHLKNTELTTDDTEGMYDAHAVATTPAAPDSVFYICRMGIFESHDQGKTMRDLEVGKQAPFKYTRDMRVNPRDPKTLYACFSISSRSERGAMFRSNDLGVTWKRADPEMNAKSTIMGFGQHVSEPGKIAAVTRHGQVLYTFDDCASWTEEHLPEGAGDAFCSTVL